MKRIFTLFVFLSFNIIIAQLEIPASSPKSTVFQTVGLTEISVEFSRPSVKNRNIFGSLVPYDKIWRTGADESTKISFSDDVLINSATIKAGTYSLYTIPNKNYWDIIFYAETDVWGVPRNWDENKVVLKTRVDSYNLPDSIKAETLQISFDYLSNDAAVMAILWDNIYVPFRITVPTTKNVILKISEVLNNNPTFSDYYKAAVFMNDQKIDAKKALEYMELAMDSNENPRFWQLRQYSLILAENKLLKKAISVAKKSLKMAEKAGNENYIKMNKASIQSWRNLK
jgi:hypothetical protein